MNVTIEGRRLGYDDFGGRGVPVVLVHGFPLDRSVWAAQSAALSAAGVRVVAVDLRGCGESEPSDGPALMEALAGDLAGVLDALAIDRAAVAGHSIGGYVALAFFRMYAERVAGLALVASHTAADAARNPNADPAQRELGAGRDAVAARLAVEGTMAAAVESYLPRYLAPHCYAHHPALVERLRALMERQNPRGCAQLVRGMKERVASDDLLEDVHVPALIVAGAEDTYLSVASQQAISRGIAGSELVVLDGVGHLPMWEAPGATSAALTRWCAQLT
ncbi:alpha/beta hydrolase [Vulcanimicrobium alpinum]|uniref:Alpha/beta hydrolase n=1 Tax=Vulcanimicrobium alpinum TaxID=3016050 RepID=A0AAN2CAT5_UNVUL|nr:alpha/beta hydrolase [Vulcanimicrobium alpinum]BDE07288.1 alpha/beta hydrolase [Vulcanimicrobium alpinum]